MPTTPSVGAAGQTRAALSSSLPGWAGLMRPNARIDPGDPGSRQRFPIPEAGRTAAPVATTECRAPYGGQRSLAGCARRSAATPVAVSCIAGARAVHGSVASEVSFAEVDLVSRGPNVSLGNTGRLQLNAAHTVRTCSRIAKNRIRKIE